MKNLLPGSNIYYCVSQPIKSIIIQVHKKMCKSLNKGKEQQFHHRDHSLNKKGDPSENQMVAMLASLPER